MNKWMIALCFLVGGCALYRPAPLMDSEVYGQIPKGMKRGRISELAGAPYEMRRNKRGQLEYVYVERVYLGPDSEKYRTYLLTFENDVLIDKSYTEENAIVDIRFK